MTFNRKSLPKWPIKCHIRDLEFGCVRLHDGTFSFSPKKDSLRSETEKKRFVHDFLDFNSFSFIFGLRSNEFRFVESLIRYLFQFKLKTHTHIVYVPLLVSINNGLHTLCWSDQRQNADKYGINAEKRRIQRIKKEWMVGHTASKKKQWGSELYHQDDFITKYRGKTTSLSYSHSQFSFEEKKNESKKWQ